MVTLTRSLLTKSALPPSERSSTQMLAFDAEGVTDLDRVLQRVGAHHAAVDEQPRDLEVR
jgi:hypothetical protein